MFKYNTFTNKIKTVLTVNTTVVIVVGVKTLLICIIKLPSKTFMLKNKKKLLLIVTVVV